MNELLATIHESVPKRTLRSEAELLETLHEAAAQARAAGMLNIVFLDAPNGDQLSVAVGGTDTVICFTSGHGNPPYFASVGTAMSDEPVLTAYAGLSHHTEYLRRWVIPIADGILAASEFLATGIRPSAVEWVEV